MKDILRIYKIKTVIAGDRDEVCGVKDYGLYVSNKLELTWQELKSPRYCYIRYKVMLTRLDH